MTEELNSSILREKANSVWPDRFPDDDGLALRVHRALSWIDRAERESDDPDARFVFYWIAFNAIYAKDIPERHNERERDRFGGYFKDIVRLDTDKRIYDAVWNRFSDSIRDFLNNKFVFQDFWDYHNRKDGKDNWEDRFNREKREANRTLDTRYPSATESILPVLFYRLYVLRNQIVHGGATWNSSVNRDQVRAGAKIVRFLVLVFVDIMLDNPNQQWGPPYYPVIR